MAKLIEKRNITRQEFDNSVCGRIKRILTVMKERGGPVRSTEIDMSAYCTRAVKMWTFAKMIRIGLLTTSGKGASRVYELTERGKSLNIKQ